MSSNLQPDLLKAFSETDYKVRHERPFVMRVGQACPELDGLMKEHMVTSAAFITAWNPFSQVQTSEVNQQRQGQLIATLKTRGLRFIEGVGQHPSNNWPGEESVLVLGLDREAARALAK